ncbi:MAG: BCD family MFS transporter [Proteobacteria bacterium]|nr:BCD family MFS transporter [Pseudomonadota bacterium]
MDGARRALGWVGIVRLGLVQTAIGAVVVLATSTLNRVMIVEFALPATVPGALVALHYAIQLARPRFGHGSDVGGRRTRWILGGMALLAAGGVLASAATALLATSRALALPLAALAYALIGLGVGAAGTSLLVLLATEVAPARRAAAATIVWIMMIAGFAVASGVAGAFLDPFSPARLVQVVGCAALAALTLAALAIAGVERAPDASGSAAPRPAAQRAFGAALRQVWAEPRTRRFAAFVFISMLAYSAQELVLEPFGARVFGLTPGQSARLSGTMHAGAVAGMVLVAITATWLRVGTLRHWVVGGCGASAAALVALAGGGLAGAGWPLTPAVFALGVATGSFAVAAIGSMMELAGGTRDGREGVRMGLWGGAQAVAFAVGGLAGTGAMDLSGLLIARPGPAYASVFVAEALLFLAAARVATAVEWTPAARPAPAPQPAEITPCAPQPATR